MRFPNYIQSTHFIEYKDGTNSLHTIPSGIVEPCNKDSDLQMWISGWVTLNFRNALPREGMLFCICGFKSKEDDTGGKTSMPE